MIGIVDTSKLRIQDRPGETPLEPGDICRSKRGDLYLITAIPPEENVMGRSSTYLYYFRLDRDGQVIRSGQIAYGAASRDWERIGHVEITFGDPDWFV